MEILTTSILVLHIVAGFLALFSGGFLMIMKKGGARHKQIGNIFYKLVWAVCVSAILLAVVKENLFLLHIGIFVGFQNFAGFRSAQLKLRKITISDYLFTFLAGINGAFMVATSNIVLVVFGAISIFLVLQDAYLFYRLLANKDVSKLAWLSRHLGMMVGTYIGIITAFLVVNISLKSNGWIIWLAPTFLFIPLMRYWNWQFVSKPLAKSKTIKAIIGICLIGICSDLYAQPYVTGGNTRHRFAQLSLGLETRTQLGKTTIQSIDQSDNNSSNSNLRLVIGGTHFWGHADFYVAIPTVKVGNANLSAGVETGAKILPWRIKNNRVSPFVGISYQSMRFQQGDGTKKQYWRQPISAGLVFNKNSFLFELSGSWYGNKPIDYFSSINMASNITPSPWSVGVGVKYFFDTTISAEKDWQSGRTKTITDTLARRKKLNGLTVAIGPSSAFFMRESSYLSQEHPYLAQHKFVSVFPEFGVGYYWHKPDLQVNLAYRQNSSTLNAFDFSHMLKRKSVTLEAYKFLADYHGFVPFVGLNVNYEQLGSTESLHNQVIATDQTSGIKPGITFGWDIRPNRLQAWYLRTNLRYIPNLNIPKANNTSFSADQLEFNYIQLVVFPGRFM